MEKKVTSVRKRNDHLGPFGELERKLCDITYQEGDEIKYTTCYLDIQPILNFINKYERYLTTKKNKLTDSINQKTFNKRIKNNLKSSPLYILFLTLFVIANTTIVSPFASILLAFSSMSMFVGTVILVNNKSFYMTSLEKGELEEITNELLECHDLKEEAMEAIKNKENADLERARITHQANQRKKDIERKSKMMDIEMRSLKTSERVRLYAEELNRQNRNNNVYEEDIPEHLKRR